MRCVMRYCIRVLLTKRSKVYDDAAMVVAHDLGHVSSSGFDCSRSCKVHMTECAQDPSSEDVLCHEMLHCVLTTKRSKTTLMLQWLYVNQDAEWQLTAAHNRSLWCVVVVDLFCSGLLIMVISRWYL